MLVFTIHAGIYDCSCWYLRRMLAISLVEEKCTSSWLMYRPISHHGFALSKAEFRDKLCLRYGWTLSRLPSTCLCEKLLTVAHALSCPFGGFPSICHNEVRDILTNSLKHVAHNALVEPHLQPITAVSDSTCDPPRPRI